MVIDTAVVVALIVMACARVWLCQSEARRGICKRLWPAWRRGQSVSKGVSWHIRRRQLKGWRQYSSVSKGMSWHIRQQLQEFVEVGVRGWCPCRI